VKSSELGEFDHPKRLGIVEVYSTTIFPQKRPRRNKMKAEGNKSG